MYKTKNKKKNNKSERLSIRVTKEEKEEIILKAQGVKKTPSTFLRELSLGYKIQSRIDQIALNELMKTRADFGRVGGLFKIWLVSNEEVKEVAMLDGYTYEKIEQIIDRLEIYEERLLGIAKRLL